MKGRCRRQALDMQWYSSVSRLPRAAERDSSLIPSPLDLGVCLLVSASRRLSSVHSSASLSDPAQNPAVYALRSTQPFHPSAQYAPPYHRTPRLHPSPRFHATNSNSQLKLQRRHGPIGPAHTVARIQRARTRVRCGRFAPAAFTEVPVALLCESGPLCNVAGSSGTSSSSQLSACCILYKPTVWCVETYLFTSLERAGFVDLCGLMRLTIAL